MEGYKEYRKRFNDENGYMLYYILGLLAASVALPLLKMLGV